MESAQLVLKQLELCGSVASEPEDAHAALKAVEQGLIRPIIGRSYALSEVEEAFKDLATGSHVGRLVITQ